MPQLTPGLTLAAIKSDVGVKSTLKVVELIILTITVFACNWPPVPPVDEIGIPAYRPAVVDTVRTVPLELAVNELATGSG